MVIIGRLEVRDRDRSRGNITEIVREIDNPDIQERLCQLWRRVLCDVI
jgi:hypothetical protein